MDDSPEPQRAAVWRPTSLRCALRAFGRLMWLSAILAMPLLLFIALRLLPSTIGITARHVEDALLRALQRGGPCCIKFGQWASTRPDILPASLCATLSSLHDSAPQHSAAATLQSLQAAFQPAQLRAVISHVAEQPIGSGCIAQVHEATATDGRRLAIKVLHPGVSAIVELDLWLLRSAARLIEKLAPVRGLRWLAISESVEQFSEFMRAQLDLRTEAANLERFNVNFSREVAAGLVRFPQPLLREGLVSETVLVETFLEGERISSLLDHGGDEDAKRRNKVIARIGLEAFLKMLLYDKFVHADLHPGNILVDLRDAQANPTVGFVDAGLVVSLTPADQANFVKLFFAIAQGDGAHGADLMLKHAPQEECDDPEAFRSGMADLVRRARFGDDGSFNLKTLRIGEVLLDVTSLIREHHVKVEPAFTTLVMSIAVLEGLGRQLDQDLDLFSVAIPMLLSLPILAATSQSDQTSHT